MNRKSWQRMALSIFGIIVIGLCWHVAIQHLYSIPVEALAAFAGITTHAFYTISAIVIFMVTGKMIYDWKMGTTTSVVEVGEQLIEKRTPAPKHFDDIP